MSRNEIKLAFEEMLTPIYGYREASNIFEYYYSSAADISQWEMDLTLLKTGKPVQYVTKRAYFFDDMLYVDENVLIPRPETEELVYLIYKTLGKSFSGKILDIGTGSGCIPLSLKKFLPYAQIVGTDISEAALAVANFNIKKLLRDITLLKSDFLDPGSRDLLPYPDCIVSNPPYIALSEKSSMFSNVLDYEPHLALFSPSDPLIFYHAIAEWVSKLKSHTPMVFVEINEKHGPSVRSIFDETGLYKSILIHKDMQGKDRIVSCLP